MKKTVSLLLMLCILLSVPVGAMAEDDTLYDYYFEFPENIACTSIEWAQEHDEQLLQSMQEDNIMLIAIDRYSDFSMTLSYESYSDMDFRIMSDVDIDAYEYYTVEKINEDLEAKAVAQDRLPHPQTEFVVIRRPFNSGSSGPFCSWYYFTVFEGFFVCVDVQYNKPELEPEHRQLVEDFIRSINFHETWNLERIDHIYGDSVTKINIVLPENWGLSDRQEPYQRFTSYGGLASMAYGYLDVYAGLGFFDRLFMRRSELDNSCLGNDFIDRISEGNELKTGKAEYGGREYYTCEGMITLEDTGEEMWISRAVHVDNGYMHMFEFNDSSDSPYFKDFEFMLENLIY